MPFPFPGASGGKGFPGIKFASSSSAASKTGPVQFGGQGAPGGSGLTPGFVLGAVALAGVIFLAVRGR